LTGLKFDLARDFPVYSPSGLMMGMKSMPWAAPGSHVFNKALEKVYLRPESVNMTAIHSQVVMQHNNSPQAVLISNHFKQTPSCQSGGPQSCPGCIAGQSFKLSHDHSFSCPAER
jgi:hypothetical protein